MVPSAPYAPVVDAILCLMLIELSALGAYRIRTGKGIPVAGLTANLVAGAGLLLALRAAMAASHWLVIAAFLLAALAAHAFDLKQRWG